MNCENIVVSVICTAYNHEKYIRKCLEGFIMQKCSFRFEVLVNDDASTDSTAEIIREYEAKYPEIIKPIYQTENQYSKGKSILASFIPLITGKYIAICEGDDYWCDPLKLQREVDALEAHPDCYMCVHRVECVTDEDLYLGKFYPPFPLEEGKVTGERFFELYELSRYLFQTSSYMFLREQWEKYYKNPPEYRKEIKVGDIPYMFYYAAMDAIYYLPQTMSHYRVMSAGSWTATHAADNALRNKHDSNMMSFLRKYDESTNYKFHEVINGRIEELKYIIFTRSTDCEKLSKNNREILRKISMKARLFIYLSVCFPKLMRKYRNKKGQSK